MGVQRAITGQLITYWEVIVYGFLWCWSSGGTPASLAVHCCERTTAPPKSRWLFEPDEPLPTNDTQRLRSPMPRGQLYKADFANPVYIL